MSIKFSTNDVATLMIKVLNENKKMYDKSNLYEQVNKYYISNPNDFQISHFLFEWERLLSNTNFIIYQKNNLIEYIGIKKYHNNLIPFTEPNLSFIYNLDIQHTIQHMCDNEFIYYKSKILSNFFKKYFPTFTSVYELLIFNKQLIGNNNIKIFIELYSDIIEPDEVISLILEKSNINYNKKQNKEIIKYNKNNYNFLFNIGFGFVGITSLFIYKNTNWFKNIKLF
jgi:hypothetical protein